MPIFDDATAGTAGSDPSGSVGTGNGRSATRRVGRQVVLALLLAALVTTAGCAGILAEERDGESPPDSDVATSTAGAAGGNGSPTDDPNESTATATGTPASDATEGGFDDDGIPAERERLLGTDPRDPDTDDDGLDDDVEVDGPTDPLVADTDGDGVDDGREVEVGTDPVLADTDDDGLDDSVELDGPTDPLVADTDDDGLLDGRELELGADPTLNDTDSDGLNDSAELDYDADPLVADTDGDGVDDGREVEVGTDPVLADTDDDTLNDSAELELGTDPTRNDTDEDGLDDARELEVGTDPTDADTDGDSLLDGWEVRGRTPGGANLPESDPLSMDLYVVMSYARDSWAPRDSDRQYVREAFDEMAVDNPDGTRGIDVHFARGGEVPIRQSFRNGGAAKRALRENSTEEIMGPRHGVYHHVIFMRLVDDDVFDGYATTPGREVLADEDQRETRNGTIPYRDRLVIRGLLQNVLGVPPEEYRDSDNRRFSRTGWTKHGGDDLRRNEYLPPHFAEQLEREGFATDPNEA